MIRLGLLIVPSLAAAVELPRRLASTGRAVTGLYPMRLRDLARALAEPVLLGRGRHAWDHGHAALLAARLIDETPELPLPPGIARAPVAAALARTLAALRAAGLPADALDGLAARAEPDDRARLVGLSALWRRFARAVEAHADPACLLREARARVGDAPWLEGAEALVADDLELAPLERELLAALARRIPVRRLTRTRPAALRTGSYAAWAEGRGIGEVSWGETVLAPLAPPPPAAGIRRLRESLFDPPPGASAADASVQLLTAPGEAAEARAIVRRLLRAAGEGVPLEEMGIVLPRPDAYAELFTDLLSHAGIPHRLHPSLPLRCGRAARSLLLLFRCRGLARAAVMEFLTFTPAPWDSLLGEGAVPRTAMWDALSREAGVVSGLDRWRIGLGALAAEDRAGAATEKEPERAERRLRRAGEAETLLGLVERLAAALDRLQGEASWPQWRDALRAVYAEWVDGRGTHGPRLEHQAVGDVLSDLGGLGTLSGRAAWAEVETVLEARFEDERLPLEPLASGGVHVGAMDAMAGVAFQWLAIPGLVEGGFPGVLRPDPFLLDAERKALAEPAPTPPPKAGKAAQLSLFSPEPASTERPLPTTQDRLREARRGFHRAVSQATGHLILSYPRADPRSGRERLPSLFFVAAAAALHGQPLSAIELAAVVHEDEPGALSLDDAVDRGERDRLRVRAGAEAAVAAGNTFFRQSRRAARGRWRRQLGPWDGLVAFAPEDTPDLLDSGIDAAAVALVRQRLDPVADGWPVSASKLATYARCGFLYLLQHVLRLQPADEPEERKRMDPMERGSLFHEVAERFLRERRDAGELPLTDTPETRRRLREITDECLDALVARSPPRFALLWLNERVRFQQTVLSWFLREARARRDSVPAHFEVSFGPARERAEGEPHSEEPVAVDLGDGRVLKVSGKIDRIDRSPDGLVLRDYKTGRLKDQGGVFRGGQQLQIPFYILAAQRLWPDQPVVKAFLDYVDGGKVVDFDPAIARGDDFRAVLRSLIDGIAGGVFVQEPASCTWCDFTQACGPSGLLEARRRFKVGDRRLQQYLRLRDLP